MLYRILPLFLSSIQIKRNVKTQFKIQTAKMNRSQSTFVVGKNAERERNRVRCLRAAFQTLQGRLPTVPPNTKLSKLDILILATNYINQLTKILEGSTIPESTINQHLENKFFHPIKKWPMRKRLYSRMNDIEKYNNDDDDDDDDNDGEENEDEKYCAKRTYNQSHLDNVNLTNQPEIETYYTLQEYNYDSQEFEHNPEKFSSHIDLFWFPTYEATL